MAQDVLIAVDMSPASDQALEEGGRLAKALKANVVLVHAFEPIPRIPMDLSLSSDYEDMVALQARSSQDQAVKLTTNAATGLRERGLEVEVVARDGQPDDLILEVAESHDVQLIVIGSHGRRGFRRYILGSVAQTMLQRTKRPLLVVPMTHD